MIDTVNTQDGVKKMTVDMFGIDAAAQEWEESEKTKVIDNTMEIIKEAITKVAHFCDLTKKDAETLIDTFETRIENYAAWVALEIPYEVETAERRIEIAREVLRYTIEETDIVFEAIDNRLFDAAMELKKFEPVMS